MISGDGGDEIEGLYGNDVIDTGAGNDHVFGRDGDDLIYGREGDDMLIGSMGTDTVYGGAGNDTLAGSQGDDEIHGGDGNDLAFIGTLEASDSIYMEAGNDFVAGGFAGSSFCAEGGSGNDTLSAGVGNDTLLGGSGDDVLKGGDGNDTLDGGGDNDTVSGGDVDDLFIVQDVPGNLLITDFGANGAADLIDLSQLQSYDTAEAVSSLMTFGPYQTTLNLDVTGGTLVVTIQHAEPLTAQDLGLSGELTGTETGEGPADFEGGESGGGTDDTAVDNYVLEGPDADYFVVDGETGAIGNVDWFTPQYSQVWDANANRTYEVSVVERDDAGAEIDRSNLELVVTQTGASWFDADSGAMIGEETMAGGGGGGDDTVDGGDGGGDAGGDGTVYTLAGADAAVFVVDPSTGDVSYQNWFTPNYDEVWDQDRDHTYEVSVIGTDINGDEVSTQHLELVVSETNAVWQDAVEGEDPDDGDTDDDTPDADTYAGDDADGVTYSLTGDDAAIFVIDPDTGDISYQNWFTPSYDDVWDADRDHVYEVSVVGTDAAGVEVSVQDIELVVTETEVVWQEAVTVPVDPEEPVEPIDPVDPVNPVNPVNPVIAAPYLNGNVDTDLLNTFDAAADLYIDAQGNSNAPIFDGSIDCHSSVHGHLANVAAFEANGDQEGLQAFADARPPPEDVQAEIDLNFDDPYGWAWLFKLDTKLQDNGIDNLSPAGEHFAGELEADLVAQIANGTSDLGDGSYSDANWKIANLIQHAQHQGDDAAEARYMDIFEQIQADTDVDGDTSIAESDFFSSLSLSAYSHVIAGATDTAQFQAIHDQMLDSVTDGSLDNLLDTEGARLDAGIGFSHSAGVAISSAYDYWALFEETQNPAFYDAYSNVMEWTETYAPEMGESIAPGHWLPNFASFGADLPGQLPVEELDGSLTAEIEEWQMGEATPVDPEAPVDPEEPAVPTDPTAPEVEDMVPTGSAADDELTGGADDDVLDGQTGKDTLDGGAGDDTLLAGYDDGTGDVFIGGTGNDTYDIENSDVSAFAFDVDLAAGSDQYGNSLSGIENVLAGNGNDTLSGDAEDNLLSGGAGADTLTGGSGDDIFSVTAEVGALQITDFGFDAEADQIDVSELASVFADAEELMAALSFDNGVTTFNIDLDDESRLVTIQSEDELDEDDFIF